MGTAIVAFWMACAPTCVTHDYRGAGFAAWPRADSIAVVERDGKTWWVQLHPDTSVTICWCKQ